MATSVHDRAHADLRQVLCPAHRRDVLPGVSEAWLLSLRPTHPRRQLFCPIVRSNGKEMLITLSKAALLLVSVPLVHPQHTRPIQNYTVKSRNASFIFDHTCKKQGPLGTSLPSFAGYGGGTEVAGVGGGTMDAGVAEGMLTAGVGGGMKIPVAGVAGICTAGVGGGMAIPAAGVGGGRDEPAGVGGGGAFAGVGAGIMAAAGVGGGSMLGTVGGGIIAEDPPAYDASTRLDIQPQT